MRLVLLVALLALVGCASVRARTVLTDLHDEPDTGCGGGLVMTVCQVREDGHADRCWTGDVRDWHGWR